MIGPLEVEILKDSDRNLKELLDRIRITEGNPSFVVSTMDLLVWLTVVCKGSKEALVLQKKLEDLQHLAQERKDLHELEEKIRVIAWRDKFTPAHIKHAWHLLRMFRFTRSNRGIRELMRYGK